jgi:hypothetical protein
MLRDESGIMDGLSLHQGPVGSDKDGAVDV